MYDKGWKQMDFICVTGDAYVDHPSFGIAIISRLIESMGYRVGIISQPRTDKDYTVFGKPKYGFFVTSGNIDSMVAHYTAAKKKRSDDFYSAGKKAGNRPDRAVIVYTKKIKELYQDTVVVIGGLEASLRRFAHYDYWDDKVRISILKDSGADILEYGMGERQTREICTRLEKGEDLNGIRGTCVMLPFFELPSGYIELPSFEKVSADKAAYARAARIEQDEQDSVYGKTLIQKHTDKYLVQYPPALPLETDELDQIYELPYERYYHPCYENQGGVPSILEVEFSVAHNRGCFGACNFCSIAFHQGRYVTVRSKESILKETRIISESPRFKGYIHDLGGPTANFRQPSCLKQKEKGLCKGKKCLAPTPCPMLIADHKEYLDILREMRSLPKIKKVFIRSGIRYDYLLCDKDDNFFKELVQYHVSGQLKVAPEHCSSSVLDCMGKPYIKAYKEFQKRYFEYTKKIGKEQYLVPYLMSSHPGSTVKDAIELALFLKKERLHPEQVQDFYPTPGTISTCMYYTGLDPYTMKPVFVPKTYQEKAEQRALLQYFRPENKEIVTKALRKAGRADLIGFGKDCLVTLSAPSKNGTSPKKYGKKGNKR